MDFDPNSDQTMMKDAVRKLSADKLFPLLSREPSDRPLSKEAMLEVYGHLAEFGLTAMRLPEELGGSGLSMVDFGLLMEELPAAIGLSLVSHDGTTVRLATGARDDLRGKYLPDLIAGRQIACTATSEAQAGSHSNAIRTSMTVSGDTAIVSGTKMWVTNASVADLYIVTCSAGKDDNGRQLNQRVLVERDRDGVSVSEIPATGLRQGHMSEINFDDVEVPATHVIGEAGDAAKLMTLVWNANRPLIGLMALGIASRALEMAKDHAATRVQFGRPLAANQLIQHDLAEMDTLISSARLLCFSALDSVDKGRRSNGIAAASKRLATENAVRAIDLAMNIHGGMGITDEMGLEQMWRDARILQVPDGTLGILSLIHGRELTGVAAF